MPERSDDQSSADAARRYATLGLMILASHYPVALPDPQAQRRRRYGCSRGTNQCPTPARHPLGTITTEQAATSPEEVAGWWAQVPQANLAAVTGPTLGVLQLRHGAPAGQVAGWLDAHNIQLGPILQAAPDTLQFLVRPADPAACYAPLAGGGLLRLAAGSLVLLPPSTRIDCYPIRWHHYPPATHAALPDREELWTILAHLPNADLLNQPAATTQPDHQAPALAGRP